MADKSDRPRGLGRGSRGRGRSTTPPKPPNPDTVARLELEGQASELPVQSTIDQFADAPSEPTSQAPTQASSLDDARSTSAGKGQTPPLVQDLKDALKDGVKVGPTSKLNPKSPEFSPSTSVFGFKGPIPQPSLSNGPSSGLDLDSHTTSSSAFPIMTKLQPLPLSTLRATAPEFVPGLPVQASLQNGGIDPTFTETQEEPPSSGPLDIIRGFKPPVEVPELETVPVMKAASEMLVKGTMYLGSFDRHKSKLETTLSSFPPSDDVRLNLAEMLVHWGILEPYFRYTSCKMCEVIAQQDSAFLKAVMRRVKVWYEQELSDTSDKNRIINFSLFFSELFTRLKVGEKPIEVLAGSVFSLMNTLLTLKTNDTIIGACNVLKLTAVLLQQCDRSNSSERLDKVIEQLRELALDSSLSRSCTELVARVIELGGRNWGESMGVSKFTTPPEEKGKLNVDAAPFVPTIFQVQRPVMSVAEWSEFATDYTETEQDFHGVEYDTPDGDDGLDPDIELEMEAFIGEIEEHLLMQDFDPELEPSSPH